MSAISLADVSSTIHNNFLKGSDGYGLVSDAVNLFGNAAATLSISAAAAQTDVLTAGIYDVWATVDCYLKVATTANDVTTANGYLVRSGTTVSVVIPTGCKLGAIAGGAGTLSYHRVA